ncbi:MAG: 50S ribosomal protein L10 [Candidatus Cloacimonetes bacterium]|nr:50S ribosomal protein L10 [Candidatus Cloacimonadota bacterium]
MIQEYKLSRVATIKERLSDAKSIVILDYKGINVEEVDELRTRMRNLGVDYFVAKNTFLKIAMKDLGIEDINEWLKGPNAIAISKTDEVAPAKVLPLFKKEFMGDKEFPNFKIGYIGGKVITAVDLNAYAELPSREELLAKMMAGFNAPISGFVGALNGIIRKFVYTIDAIANKEN